MSILEFIFGIIVLIVLIFIVTGVTCTKYDVERIEKENIRLREDLKKARGKKVKHEYKKVSNIGGEK